MAITDNTQKINRLLEAINALPNAESGGVELPELTNPGTADDLMYGKELIGQNGEKITGNVQMIPSGNTGLIASTDNVSLVENNSSKYIDMEWTFPFRVAFDEQSALHVQSNTANFGDATAADVAAGKTFTSASGLKVVGTKANTGGGGGLPIGVSALETGEYVPGQDYTSGVDIAHGLGVAPNFCVWWLEEDVSTNPIASLCTQGALIAKTVKYNVGSDTVYTVAYMLAGYNTSSQYGGTTSRISNNTYMTSTIFHMHSSTTYKLLAGHKYRWVAGVADSVL